MGDRWYTQMKNSKPKRELKKDIVKDIFDVLKLELKSLNNMTVEDLKKLRILLNERL